MNAVVQIVLARLIASKCVDVIARRAPAANPAIIVEGGFGAALIQKTISLELIALIVVPGEGRRRQKT